MSSKVKKELTQIASVYAIAGAGFAMDRGAYFAFGACAIVGAITLCAYDMFSEDYWEECQQKKNSINS